MQRLQNNNQGGLQMLKKNGGLFPIFKTIISALILVVSLTACAANTLGWKEEVKLLDGRVIVVSIKYRFEHAYNGSNYGGVLRES